MFRKCINNHTGKPRAVYRSYDEASRVAGLVGKKSGTEFYPYRCPVCGKYHIAAFKDKLNFVKNGCGCTDSSGKGKNLYLTYEDALKARSAAMEKRRVDLIIYKCPEREGWHLSHRKTFLEKHGRAVVVLLAVADTVLAVIALLI